MKHLMNFTTSSHDIVRYASAADLEGFYRQFGCDGLEVMPWPYMDGDEVRPAICCPLVLPHMVVGVHVCCTSDWMDLGRAALIARYREDLEYAKGMGASYVVFHVAQASDGESFTYKLEHTDEEVIREACALINELLDGSKYSFYFLMENLWWPGLTFLDPAMTRMLLQGIHYEKKGFMLDTGHFLHTNRALRSQEEAIEYLSGLLSTHHEFLPYIRGIHLQQSLTGAYVDKWLKVPHTLPEDPDERFCKVFEHIFAIDRHEPFTAPGIREVVEQIDPLFLTYEYITNSRQEHADYLERGSRVFR